MSRSETLKISPSVRKRKHTLKLTPSIVKKIKAKNTLDKRVCIFDQETRTQRGGGAGSVWRIVAGTTGAWPAA